MNPLQPGTIQQPNIPWNPVGKSLDGSVPQANPVPQSAFTQAIGQPQPNQNQPGQLTKPEMLHQGYTMIGKFLQAAGHPYAQHFMDLANGIAKRGAQLGHPAFAGSPIAEAAGAEKMGTMK
jgi:hypothetical protein